MSDNLDSFFKQHQEDLQPSEPDNGHAERFAARLLAEPSKKKASSQWKIWTAAACATLLIAVAGWITLNPPEVEQIAQETDTVTTLTDLSPEYADVEIYYQQLVTSRMLEVDQLTKGSNQDWTQLQETLQDLEEHYKRLQVDLSRQPKNSLIINSMIKNYRLRVQILEQLITELEKSLPKNSNDALPQV